MPNATPSALESGGARAETKYTSLQTIKFIAGYQHQRSVFCAVDTRYGTKFLGGKPDALIDGSNCEISNSLTLIRRPGTVAYGAASVPPPKFFYAWEQVVPPNLTLMVDTASAVYNYSTTFAGNYLNKAALAGQTSFYGLVNTLYMGDGVDLYKIVGPNLLVYSNTFEFGTWPGANNTYKLLIPDPLGNATARVVEWTATGSSAYIYQTNTPNYIPVGGNTFTFSIWIKLLGGAQSLTLSIEGGSGSVRNSATFALTSSWVLYQVTALMDPADTAITVVLGNPTSDGTGNEIAIYGSQLEVGGPASPTQITTTIPQGVYLWGIVGPVAAPTYNFSQVGNRWQALHTYATSDTVVDTNGNLQTATAGGGGMSGASVPTWNAAQNGTTTDGALTWTNGGLVALTATIGYQWYYAFGSSLTGNVSAVSPISVNTGDTADT